MKIPGITSRSKPKPSLPAVPVQPHWSLAQPLIHLSPNDWWTIGDSIEGLLCTGRSGGGKSSGTGEMSLSAMVHAGYGGLILAANASEIDFAERICHAAGRGDDLIVIRPGGMRNGDCAPWRFNPVDHELRRKGDGAGHVENVVGMYAAILDLADRAGSASGGPPSGHDGDPFWRQSTMRMLRNFVGLLVLALGTVTISDLYQAILSAPQSAEEARSESWKTSFTFRLLKLADDKPKTPHQRHDFGLIADYILKELPLLPQKTRGSIVAMFTAMSDALQRGVLHDLFGTDTTFTPEATEHGRIIVVGLSVKEYGELGLIANVLMKYAWQRSIERRANEGPGTRPVFLYADEAQYFVTARDMLFQTTCRHAKVATVLLTQNVSNFYAALGGGEKGRAEADSLFANLNTKVFHSNGDAVTNQWAAEQIGRSRQFFLNTNQSSHADDWFETVTGMGNSGNSSTGMSEQMDFEVQPSAFTMLRTGGAQHDKYIDAVVYQSGRTFNATGKAWLPVTFRQK